MRVRVLVFAACVVLPCGLALSSAPNVADAAHAEGAIRAGLGDTGILRAFDAWLAAFFQLMPIGTHAFRAEIAPALFAGLLGGLVFELASALMVASRLSHFVAGCAALLGALSPSVQIEAIGAGGSTIAAVLSLAPVVAATRGRVALVAGLAALAIGYEPVAGAAGLVMAAVCLATTSTSKPGGLAVIANIVLGLSPTIWAIVRHRSIRDLALPVALVASPFGERGACPRAYVWPFAREELGFVALAFVAVGAIVAVRAKESRWRAAAMIAGVAVGAVAIRFGAPAGPTRVGALVLMAIACASVLAACGMHALVVFVDGARVSFARASAMMVVAIELALPARAADDARTRCDLRSFHGAAIFDDASFRQFRAGSLVLVSDLSVLKLLLAARATGELGREQLVLPVSSLAGALAQREIAQDAGLAPLVRDIALYDVPQEYALSRIASERPVAVAYDERWDRSLARHLVASGLFDRFFPEPRGPSDRRIAIDAFFDARVALVQRSVRDAFDPEIVTACVALLKQRALVALTLSERDTVGKALDDLRPFAAEVVAEIVKGLGKNAAPSVPR